MQRAAGRVAGEALQVQRLRDHPLTGERRVAVQQEREGDRGVVRAVRRGAIRLLGAGPALDDRVDRFEVARVRHDPNADAPVHGRPRSVCTQVVLDVAGAALGVGGHGVERALAFELAQDLLVRHPDRVSEHVQPPAMRHAHHDLVRPVLRGELDRLVEHRDHHVEPFERELLLPEEPLAQESLHSLDLAEAAEERSLLVGRRRLAVRPGLDRAPQPEALLVIGEVLELVGDASAIGLDELGQHVGERLAGHVHAEHRCRDAGLQLGRQPGLEPKRLERRVTDRLRSERVEPRAQVAVRPVRLDERHRRRDAPEQLRVGVDCLRSLEHDDRGCDLFVRFRFGCRLVTVLGPVAREPLEQPREPRMGLDQMRVAALEQRAPGRRNAVRVLEVLVEQRLRVATVQTVDVAHAHSGVVPRRALMSCPPGAWCSATSVERMARDHLQRGRPDDEAHADHGDRDARQPLVPAAHHGRDECEQERHRCEPERAIDELERAQEERCRGQQAGDGLDRARRVAVLGSHGETLSRRATRAPPSRCPCGPPRRGLGPFGARHGRHTE